MVINGIKLFLEQPVSPMVGGKSIAHGVSYGLGEAGYDIRIRETIVFTHDLFGDRKIIVEHNDMKGITCVSSRAGRFVLASTIEEFNMPADLVGVVHDKSTWARRGLSVFNTVIEPGWKGFLTLELVYHGEQDLRIEAGSGIAQVLFSKLSNPARYEGRYQNQAAKPVGAIDA